MVRMFQGRWAATGFLFACPGAVLACSRGYAPPPPLYWQDFAFDWQPRPAVPPENFVERDAAFVTKLIPGQMATPAPAADAEAKRDDLDTGFRQSMEPFATSEAFPSHLDGALIDVTGETAGMQACSEAIVAFERAVESHGRWLMPAADEDTPPPETDDRSPSRATCLSLTGEVWELAEPTEEVLSVQRWLLDTGVTVAPRRRLVFDDPSSEANRIGSIKFDLLDSLRPTVTVERIWPARPVLTTLVVTYFESGRCGSRNVAGKPLVHRIPLASMATEP